jgi:SH3-like domain-containing protein
MRRTERLALSIVPIVLAALPAAAPAAEYRSTAELPTILYDAPSTRSKPLFVFGREVPLETLVSVEGWTKVRDMTGTIGWIANKSLAEKRMLVVRASLAEVRGSPDEGAPIVFRAEQNVLLELAEPASSSAATGTPGWVKVRHRDGQSGFVRVSQIFGL